MYRTGEQTPRRTARLAALTRSRARFPVAGLPWFETTPRPPPDGNPRFCSSHSYLIHWMSYLPHDRPRSATTHDNRGSGGETPPPIDDLTMIPAFFDTLPDEPSFAVVGRILGRWQT